MSEQNLSAMTVIELRKLAREMHVPLSAGISKQGIIERLSQAMSAESQAPADSEDTAVSAPAEPEATDEAEAPEKPQEAAKAAADAPVPAPGFRGAAAAPRFNTRPAYQAPAYPNRPSASRSPAADAPRPQATRSTGFTPRFGPAVQEAPAAPREEERVTRPEPPRPTYQVERRPVYGDAPRFQQRPAYEQPARPAPESRPAAELPARQGPEQRPAYEARPALEQRPAAEARPAPTPSEMLTPAECLDGSGVLELHPDGYGFLRSDSLLPSGRDIYVAAAQVRRFGLRTGDRINGKIRPQRDGDKYSALLYVTAVNGVAAEGHLNRPSFDEMVPIYPNRPIHLTSRDGQTPAALRLIDLVTPMGFGQRALMPCPPETDKAELMKELANAICANHPDASVMLLLFNVTPEDATLLRDSVSCPVLASTFDMPPEHHLRLAELAVDAAARMVEMKRDVVLIADNLTTLSRVCTTAALQQGRQVLGAVSPTSLQKAKRLFGSARCLREGGSLTVIGMMNNDVSSKVDEAIINDFRSAANLELTLDAALAAKGVNPPVDLLRSGTKRAELFASPAHVETLACIRTMLRDAAPEAVALQLLGMLGKTADNDELYARLPGWLSAARK